MNALDVDDGPHRYSCTNLCVCVSFQSVFQPLIADRRHGSTSLKLSWISEEKILEHYCNKCHPEGSRTRG